MAKLSVSKAHEQAMSLAEEATIARHLHKALRAAIYFRRAQRLETMAASMLPAAPENEPSRSVLYRSAASLACSAHNYRRARALASQGLAGFPPADIRAELLDVLNNQSVSGSESGGRKHG